MELPWNSTGNPWESTGIVHSYHSFRFPVEFRHSVGFWKNPAELMGNSKVLGVWTLSDLGNGLWAHSSKNWHYDRKYLLVAKLQLNNLILPLYQGKTLAINSEQYYLP